MTKKRAFTLIELLVVIAIIALLLAILLPSLAKIKKISRRLACSTNLRSIGQAFHLYGSEYDEKIVQGFCSDTFTYWSYALKDYYESEELLLCPEATEIPDRHESTWSSRGFNWRDTFGTPDKAWKYVVYHNGKKTSTSISSYGTNAWVHSIYRPLPFRISITTKSKNFWGGKITDCGSDVPLMLDCIFPIGYPMEVFAGGSGEPLNKREMENFDTYNSLSLKLLLDRRGWVNSYAFDRHDKHINTVFMDGSVRSVKVEDLWTLRWTRDFPKKTVTIEW